MLQIKNTLGGGKPEGSYVWKKYEYISDPYLSFLGNEEFTLNTLNTTKNWNGTLEYSTDTITWNTWDGVSVISSSGNNLYLRGTGNTKITGRIGGGLPAETSFVFTGTDALRISCEGNIENLLDYETVITGNHPTMENYCYSGMFYGCTSLINAPKLPATTLSDYCYDCTFWGCENLKTAPELSAITLASHCYADMFRNCTSLTTAPELPATVLATTCYKGMFYGCKSLTTAPELPATELAIGCYADMFKRCTSLIIPPELPATVLASSCYNGMFYGCKRITIAPELPAVTLASNCYDGMFYECTSLVTPPELPATTLASYCYKWMFYRCTNLTTPPSILPATTLVEGCYQYMFEFSALEAIPIIMATSYASGSCNGMFDDVKTLYVYSSSGPGHTYGWTAPTPAVDYCDGMFGSDDGESEWAKLDDSNFPNDGTPTDGATYYFGL